MGKASKFFTGMLIFLSSLVGAKKANAQYDEYGVANMTEKEKTERLAEIKHDIDSIDAVIATKQANYELIKEFTLERFPFDEYKNRTWELPSGMFIRDDILKNLEQKIKETQDSTVLSILKKDKELLKGFFASPHNSASVYVTAWSIASAAKTFSETLNYLTKNGEYTIEEGKRLTQYFTPYYEVLKKPTVSKFDAMNAEFQSQAYNDYTKLSIGYKNGEFSPAEYQEQKQKLDKIYDLLSRVLKVLQRDKELSQASSMADVIARIRLKMQHSTTVSYHKKEWLLEEQNAILMPPVEKQHENKKKGGRHALLPQDLSKVH